MGVYPVYIIISLIFFSANELVFPPADYLSPFILFFFSVLAFLVLRTEAMCRSQLNTLCHLRQSTC